MIARDDLSEQPVKEQSPPQLVAAVILDVDGTLVDSNDAHARAFVSAMHEAGFDASYEHVRGLIGKGSDRLIPEAVGVEKDSGIGERIVDRKKALFKEKYLSALEPLPGARELILELRRRKLKLIAASSAGDDELADLLKAALVDDLLKRHTSSDEVSTSKPSPDVVRTALDDLGTEPHNALMIGDTPYDVEAAVKAGVPIIALRCGGWNDQALQGAAAIYDDPADVLRHLDNHIGAGAISEAASDK